MRKSLLFLAIVSFLTIGCATAPMTAKSKLSVPGDVVVTEKTTTTTTNVDGTMTTKVVEKTVTKSAPAADLELKEKELEARRDVGVASASSVCWGCGYNNRGAYYNSSGGYYNGGSYGTTQRYSTKPHSRSTTTVGTTRRYGTKQK